MAFLPKNILSWQEGFRLVTNRFGVRFIELKESQLKSFQSSSKQPFHFPETDAHGNEQPGSPRDQRQSGDSPPAFYFRVLFRNNVLPQSWPFPTSLGANYPESRIVFQCIWQCILLSLILFCTTFDEMRTLNGATLSRAGTCFLICETRLMRVW